MQVPARTGFSPTACEGKNEKAEGLDGGDAVARAPGGRGSVRVLEHARLVRPLRARTWRPAQREAVDNLSGYVDMGKEPAGLFFS